MSRTQEVSEAVRLIAEKRAAMPTKTEREKMVRPPLCDKCGDVLAFSPGPYCDCAAGRQSERLWKERLDNEAQRKEEQRQRALEKLDRLVKFSPPARFKELSLSTLTERQREERADAIFVLTGWIKGNNPKPSVYLWGEAGRGKTVLALAVIRKRAEETGEDVRAMRYMDFINAVQSTYNDNNGKIGKLDLIRAVQRCEILLIDDFGQDTLATQASTDKQDMVREILDWRCQRGLPTIIISNLSPNHLRAQFSPATVSRIIEMAEAVEMGGDDLRKEGAVGKW